MPESQAPIHARRKAGAAIPPTSIRWPTYLVSSPHSVSQGPVAGHPRLPYGQWHARRIGSYQTECGRSAITWHYFWTLEFGRAGSLACPECLRVLSYEH